MEEKQIFEEAQKNKEFLDKNFKIFEKEYPNKFIAVSGANVVGTGETPDAVFEIINQKKIDKSNVLVEFIPIAGSILIL